jgi:hypothetical protein
MVLRLEGHLQDNLPERQNLHRKRPNKHLKLFWQSRQQTLRGRLYRQREKGFYDKKTILWQSNDATDKEVNKKEVELILKYQSNNPKIGYNRLPKFKEK